MKPDIQKKLKADFGDDFYAVLDEINKWDIETKSLLEDRLLRSVIHLSEGKIEKFLEQKELSRLDPRDIYWQAEYDCGEERIRDFSRPFGSETKQPIQQ
ncbi:hypothetical protein N9X20_02090 [Opitutales bacterium]|nr:hypothetical protein [Opitutales bacterium]